MCPYVVVVIHIRVNQLMQLSWQMVFVGIELFRLETAEPSLNHDVTNPAASAIHALSDVGAAKQ